MRKRNIGQWLALTGNLVISIGLLLSGFGVISQTGLRITAITAVIIDVSALVFIWKNQSLDK